MAGLTSTHARKASENVKPALRAPQGEENNKRDVVAGESSRTEHAIAHSRRYTSGKSSRRPLPFFKSAR